jgi:mxaJ protein
MYKRFVLGALTLGLGWIADMSGPAQAADLRVCASENEAPFSMRDESGFENRVAKIVADAMGRKLVTVWAAKPAIYLVRDFLDRNKCDVVMGLDTGDERVLTTIPYYRTGYVLVTRADRRITATGWSDAQFKELDTIAVKFNSPGEQILRQTGRYENTAVYLFSLVGFKSPRNQYVQVSGDRLIQEVIEGRADGAIAFAPEVARYVKASPVALRMTVLAEPLPLQDGKRQTLHYDQSMGVRKDDPQLKAALDAAIEAAAAQLREPLEAEGIPLLRTPS